MNTNRQEKTAAKAAKMVALPVFIITLLIGGGCSSRHGITASYNQEQAIGSEVASQDVVDGYADDSEFSDGEVVNGDAGNITEVMNNVAGNVFKVSDVLFAISDSLNTF